MYLRSVPAAYTFGVIAMTGLGSLAHAQGPIVTLTPSDFNGYNITCFGAQDGAIDAAVSGGTAPYTYSWTNGAATEDISSLASGYYKLLVTDAYGQTGEADITLTEPKPLTLEMEPFKYPSGLNISCFECYNGSIDVSVHGGVEPYAYTWNDDATTQDRSGLGAMSYAILVTDANGCATKDGTFLKQPDRDDWTMSGNANTDPSTQYIGTSDAQDVVLKANGQEMLRLKANGDFSLLGSLGTGILYRSANGTLRSGGFPDVPPMPYGGPCAGGLELFPLWVTSGNDFSALCEPEQPLLGTLDDTPLRIVTNGLQRMVILPNGKVGIGTTPTGTANYRLYVEDGIVTRDVLVKLGNWPDYVFDEGYRLMPLGELRAFLRVNKHLPTMLSAAQLEENGGAEVGDTQRRLVRTAEEQALYILQLEQKCERLEERNRHLENRFQRLEERLTILEATK